MRLGKINFGEEVYTTEEIDQKFAALGADVDARLAGKASLEGGKVPSDELPSYVDDVEEYASLAGFPEEGEEGKIYVAKDTNKTYRWTGTQYTKVGGDDAILTPVYSDTPTFSEWVCSPAELYGETAFVEEINGFWILSTPSISGLETGPEVGAEDTRIDFEIEGVTATRTRTDITGYTLGDQDDKPIAPAKDYALKSDIPDISGLATKGEVAAKANDSDVLHKSGDETASGKKVFSTNVSIGNNNISASHSFAVGAQNTVSDAYSVAIGSNNTASGGRNLAVGVGHIVPNLNEAAFGSYSYHISKSSLSNDIKGYATCFSVGCGTASERLSALSIRENGQVYILNVGGWDGKTILGTNLDVASAIYVARNVANAAKNTADITYEMYENLASFVGFSQPDCLTPYTRITMADGSEKFITEVEVGDKVLSPFGEDEVTGVFHGNKGAYDIWEFEDGAVVTTVGRHRFWNCDLGEPLYLEAWNIGEYAVRADKTKVALVSHMHVESEYEYATLFTKTHNLYYANGLLAGNRNSTRKGVNV